MKFSVITMRRDGIRIDRRDLFNQPRHRGDLRVEQHTDDLLGRASYVARLIDPSAPIASDVLPPLYDVRLVGMSQLAFVLAGIERQTGRAFVRELGQSWLIQPD